MSTAVQHSAELEAAVVDNTSLEQLMSQLADLDKMGQEGAQPVDDAEVGHSTVRLQFSAMLPCTV